MSIEIYTVGFKYPDWERKLDSIGEYTLYDVRDFINDPAPKLKGLKLHELRATDRKLRDLILSTPKGQRALLHFRERVKKLLSLADEGEVTRVVFACTAGHHRSVAIAVELGAELAKQHCVTITHLYP